MATLIYSMCSSSSSSTLTKSSSFPACSRPPLRSTTTIEIRRSISHVAQAKRGLSSRNRRLEKRDKKGSGLTTTKEEEEEEEINEQQQQQRAALEIGGEEMEYSTEPMPKLQGLEPDFWEGPQWNAFGFFVQYMWAFGILFGLVACGIAVSTYNDGATDFKQTTSYKESIQSKGLLEEEPDASTADVFEANPTESAPSLE